MWWLKYLDWARKAWLLRKALAIAFYDDSATTFAAFEIVRTEYIIAGAKVANDTRQLTFSISSRALLIALNPYLPAFVPFTLQ